MKQYPAFAIALVKDGKVQLSPAQRKILAHKTKELEGQYARVSIARQDKPRSDNQNRYYWGVIIAMIAAETGHTGEEIHEVLKKKFLPRQFTTILDEEVEISRSTTRLSTSEFEEYMEQCRIWASTTLSMTIPLPHEVEVPLS